MISTSRPSLVCLWHIWDDECTLSVAHCLGLNLQLHTIDFVRTYISSFCTVAWHLAWFQLTRHIARSLGDSWASCTAWCQRHVCEQLGQDCTWKSVAGSRTRELLMRKSSVLIVTLAGHTNGSEAVSNQFLYWHGGEFTEIVLKFIRRRILRLS